MIKLNEKFELDTDATHGFKLIHNLPERKYKNKDGSEKLIFPTEEYYFPSLSMALQRAIDLEFKGSNSIDEIVLRLDKMEKSIDEFKNVFAGSGKVFSA
jgi:hypothetical protein